MSKIAHLLIASASALLLGGLTAQAFDAAEAQKRFNALPDWNDTISGAPYDYTATMKPERPYMHQYDKLMMHKFFMARPDQKGGSNVGINFEEALDMIKGLDRISRGVPKIVYLVGWQFEGHDCKYPAFDRFNEALKRPQDATARDSYRWLREEAKKYNTTVSVHVLVQDAEPDSPLWKEYSENDFICRDTDGNLITRAVFNGQPMYDVNIANEWQKGFLQKRLDGLIELVELKDAGTMHCDAYYARMSPGNGQNMAQQEEAMRKMLRYMRNKGVDVTIEFIHNGQRCDPMIGLSPAAWWLDLSGAERAKIPASLLAGGQEGKFGKLWLKETFLFGDNYQAEDDFNFVDLHKDKNWAEAWNRAKLGVATRTLPYLFYNTLKLENYDEANERVYYSDSVVTDWKAKTVKQGDTLLRQGNDVFFPVVWRQDGREIMAYSQAGYQNRTWKLPKGGSDVKAVMVTPVEPDGEGTAQKIKVTDGAVTLTLAPNTILSVVPAK